MELWKFDVVHYSMFTYYFNIRVRLYHWILWLYLIWVHSKLYDTKKNWKISFQKKKIKNIIRKKKKRASQYCLMQFISQTRNCR